MRIRDVALKTCQRRWTIGRSSKREYQGYLCWRYDMMMTMMIIIIIRKHTHTYTYVCMYLCMGFVFYSILENFYRNFKSVRSFCPDLNDSIRFLSKNSLVKLITKRIRQQNLLIFLLHTKTAILCPIWNMIRVLLDLWQLWISLIFTYQIIDKTEMTM